MVYIRIKQFKGTLKRPGDSLSKDMVSKIIVL